MAEVEAVPLSDEDRAILELEGPLVAGHTAKVAVLGAPAPSPAELRALVAERIEAVPELRRRLGGSAAEPAWVDDPDFDPAAHVQEADEPIAIERLGDWAATVFEQHLPRERPLWRIDRAPLQGGGAALIWRLHHALADGTAAMRLARELLWDPEGSHAEARRDRHRRAAEDHDRRRGHLAAFLRREVTSFADSPFDGEISPARSIAFTELPFAPLHDAAKSLAGATANDALLCVGAGGIRRWLDLHGGDGSEIRMRVPVSLHAEGEHAANRDSFFTLGVPLAEPDPVLRLTAIRRASGDRKRAGDAEVLDRLEHGGGHLVGALADLLERIEGGPRSFAVCVSNVRGPARPVSVLGSPVEPLHTVAEIGRRHGLRVAALSYAGTLGLGFCADPGLVGGLEAMAAGARVDAEALVAAA